MEINWKNIGWGVLGLFLILIALSLVFEETTINSETINNGGEEITVESINENFFAKITNFIRGLFGQGFYVTITTTPEVGKSFTAYFDGSIDGWCKPTSVNIYVLKDGIQKQWIYGSTSSILPKAGSNYNYQISYTPTSAGTHQISHQIFGDPQFASFTDQLNCVIPPKTESWFCQAILSNSKCTSTELSQCQSRTVSSLTCDEDLKTFTVVSATTTTTIKPTTTTVKPTTTTSTTSTTTTTSTLFPTTTTLSECSGIGSFFDYNDCPTRSYATLGVLLIGIISAIFYLPIGGKK